MTTNKTMTDLREALIMAGFTHYENCRIETWGGHCGLVMIQNDAITYTGGDGLRRQFHRALGGCDLAIEFFNGFR